MQRLGFLERRRAADRGGAQAQTTSEPKAPRQRKAKTTKAGNGEATQPPEIPDGTVGVHANGKFACEVCGAEFEDEGQVTSHYIDQHANQ